jgi:hypothetical protein
MTRENTLVRLGLACLAVGLAAVVAGVLFGRAPVAKAVAVNGTVKPTQSAAEADRNDGLALSTLTRNGANLAKRTTITHYLYVPELGEARAAADALERRGFAIVIERPLVPATGSGVRTDWSVVASRAETPTLDHLRAARAVFQALARRYRGSYDGWEAAVVH